jgi:two-component system response regulator
VGAFVDAPQPDLVLLDLNLPKKNGREVLAEIKGDAELKHIPVVVLTTSSSDRDVLESYDLHANCYVRKPVQFQAFIEVVQSIEDFWFAIVTLPRPPRK